MKTTFRSCVLGLIVLVAFGGILWFGGRTDGAADGAGDQSDVEASPAGHGSSSTPTADAPVLPTPPVADSNAPYLEALTQAERDLVLGTEAEITELDAIRAGFAPAGALPVVSADYPHLAVFTDPGLPLDTRIPEDFRAHLPQVEDPILREGLLALFMRPEEDILVRHEAANVLVASRDPLAPIAFALVALDQREVARIRGYAIQHLENAREAGMVTARDLRPLFRHVWSEAQDEELRREALLNAARAEDESILHSMQIDPGGSTFAGMEDLVMQVWLDHALRDPRLERQAILWLDHASPMVRAVACQVVGQWHLTDGLERLNQLKQDDVPSVIRAAEHALVAFE